MTKQDSAQSDPERLKTVLKTLHISTPPTRIDVELSLRREKKINLRKLQEVRHGKIPSVLSLRDITLRRVAIQLHCGTFPRHSGTEISLQRECQKMWALDTLLVKPVWIKIDREFIITLLQYLECIRPAEWT